MEHDYYYEIRLNAHRKKGGDEGGRYVAQDVP